ncbi:MAG: ABC transporter substrate-binding protein [Burkholderiales bacterium]
MNIYLSLKRLFRGMGGVLRSVLLVAAAGILTAAQAQTVQGVTETEILIGVVTDLSGPLTASGGNQRNGMIMAAEEINAAGGVHGRKINMMFEDSGMDPKKAVLATQKLLSDNKIFAMIGTLGSAATQASMPLALERNVPVLFPIATGDIAFKPFHPLKFGLQPLSSEHMRVAVKFAYEKLGKRHFGIIYQDDETGQSALRAAEVQLKALGLTVVERASYKRGDTNRVSQIARLKAANIDMLLLGGAGTPADIAGVALETRAQNWPIDMITYSGAIAAVVKLGGPAVEGLYSMGMFTGTAQDSTPPFQAVLDRYKARFGYELETPADYGYVSLMLFAEGAKNAGRNLTPQTLSQGLEKVKNFKTVFAVPPISYGPNDHSPPSEALVLQVRDGKWKVVAGPLTVN